ncbi:glycosyltransferase family 2 protein [Empedobacter sp. ULE_I140]
MPKVSVIIPNYNHSSYLKERIDSILNQTFQNFEVIILDDCSTDNSKEIIELYRDHTKVSHIVYNEKNSGSTFRQWKKGIDLSKGEWIWLAESDDVAEQFFLEKLCVTIENCKDVVLAYSASNLIDENSNKIGRLDWGYIGARNWENNYCENGQIEIENYLFYRNTLPNASGIIFKKSKIQEETYEIVSKMKYAGDWYFWVKLLEKGELCFISEELNNFRQHQQTTRTTKSTKEEIRRFKEYFIVLNYIKNKYKIKWNISYHHWIFDSFITKYGLNQIFRKPELLKNFPAIYNYYLLKKLILKRIN